MYSIYKIFRVCALVVIAQLWATTTQAQVAPVQNQFYLNPYIYNPAWVGSNDQNQLFLGVKKQWVGVEGAPTIATLTYEHAMEDNPASMGVQVVNISEGPINTLAARVTAGYRLETGLDSYLYFGMSLGLVHNAFNANALDAANDPLVMEQNANSVSFDGGFGFGYESNGLRMGLALPRFTAPRPFVKNNDGKDPYSPWDYMIGSLSYTFEPDLDWEFTPAFLYHMQKGFNNQWELGLTAAYQKKLNLGTIYRQNTGLTVLAGFSLSDNVSLNYMYSFSSPTAKLPNDSHELVIRLAMGRKGRR
ncbi:type IX secretion system membrane protein PorP/SprF [uncultured Microscilla sp.]|uniref:PorP/SprF family type IX secretion system membrane protein n=1 Tax=uncultured Microscilla sp. TaxID=432653 RepID=UPI002603D7E5|nr:type IX secretion system membrane protein PorP/SprF [uncultured Microscilla sp.]